MSGSLIFFEYYLLSLFLGMVQVSGEFPAPRLSAGHMGPSSVAFLFGFLSTDVLAALLLKEHSKRGKCCINRSD